MSKKYDYLSIIFFCLLIISCREQPNSDSPKDNASKIESSGLKLSPEDPYFIKSTSVNSLYGPNSITRNILQDRSGNIWFATWEGIIRYDGKTFTNFTNKEGLRLFHVFSLLEDKTGIIWFGTIGAGLYRYDSNAEKTGEQSFVNITTKDGLINSNVGCIYEDKSGNLWFGTMGGISYFDKSSAQAGEISFQNFTTKEGLTNNDVNSIIEDKNGKIWIGTRGEACFYEPFEDFTLRKPFTRIINNKEKPFTNVRSIITDRKGNIWIGGNDGLWCYEFPSGKGKEGSFRKIKDNFVGYIYEDKKGDIWTSSEGTNSGGWELSRYDLPIEKGIDNSASQQIIAKQIKTGEGMIFGISEDAKGGLWFGTLDGVCRYNQSVERNGGKLFNYFRTKKTGQ